MAASFVKDTVSDAGIKKAGHAKDIILRQLGILVVKDPPLSLLFAKRVRLCRDLLTLNHSNNESSISAVCNFPLSCIWEVCGNGKQLKRSGG